MAKSVNHIFEAFNYRGVKESRTVYGVLIFQHDMVALIYHPRAGLFTVVYGLEVSTDLDHNQAHRKLGAALIHQAECDGLLS